MKSYRSTHPYFFIRRFTRGNMYAGQGAGARLTPRMRGASNWYKLVKHMTRGQQGKVVYDVN